MPSAKDVVVSKIKLDYPLYAVDFDPQDPARLIVGGGGGPGRTGVANKITLLNAAAQDALIYQTAELELRKDEDNVTTLAIGPHKAKTTSSLVLAGVNATAADLKNGKNQHLRVFSVDQVSQTKTAIPPKMAELSRSSLFSSKDESAYQRLLRLSTLYEGFPQVGACATGLSQDAQIALFDMTSAGPKQRGLLEIPKEAVDLDLIQTGDKSYSLAYCNGDELWTVKITSTTVSEPRLAYTIPYDTAIGATTKPSFRCIRYLTPTFILAACNLPNRSGVVLSGFRFQTDKVRLSVSAKLPKKVGHVTGLAVRNLTPAAKPSDRLSDAQFVAAVATGDGSLCIYTVEHTSFGEIDVLAKLYPFLRLQGAHEGQITGLALSPFRAPDKTTTRTQYVKLASVSVTGSVVVHHIPLKKVFGRAGGDAAKEASRGLRYAVALKSKGTAPLDLFVIIALTITLLGVALQAALEIQGSSQMVVGARLIAPASWLSPLKPHVVPAGSKFWQFRETLMQRRLEGGGDHPAAKPVLLRENTEPGAAQGVEVTNHDEDLHGPALTWEELSAEQKALWRERLTEAGHWGESVGENIFKGVVFSELAGVVNGLLR